MNKNYFSSLIDRLNHNSKLYVGYPPNIDFDYSSIFEVLNYFTNNIGDPFDLSNPFSTHEFEVAVIRWFAQLFGGNENTWGYVTNGGTEGIIFGLWNARDQLNDPVIYFSEFAHYAASKTAKLLKTEFKVIKSMPHGEMDYDDLERQIDSTRDAIILATLGSTITSSIDDVKKIKNCLSQKKVNFYIHADAAIDGMVLPFTNTRLVYKLSDGINSLSISGHKIIGSPVPCSIALANKNFQSKNVFDGYLKLTDNTISSSRSGISPLILWYAIKQKGEDGFRKLIQNSIWKAENFCKMLNDANIPAWRFKDSIVVVTDELPKDILKKWRAPSFKGFTSFTCLPKLNQAKMEAIIEDILYYSRHAKMKDDAKILYPASPDSDDIRL